MSAGLLDLSWSSLSIPLRCGTIFFLLLIASAGSRAEAPAHLYFPAEVKAPSWVAARRAAQLEAIKATQVPRDFRFVDVQPRSGLNFQHRVVDDAGLTYKAAHYDHGSGVAIADVDGDGHMDILFVNQAGPNGLFRNLGNGRFEDVTEQAGVGLPQDIGVGASFADVDNDGDPDLYLTHVRSPNRLFENLGGGRFKDITDSSGLGVSEHSSGAVFLDYDRDGLLDIFLTVVGEYTTDERRQVVGTPPAERLKNPPSFYVAHRDAFAGHLKRDRFRNSLLFKNQGDNKFENVTALVGLVDYGWSGDASVTDFNRDGWPDLYVLNMQGPDEYWINQQGEKFTPARTSVFKATPWGSMGVKSFDFNNDGLMDLLLTDMHSDMSEVVAPDIAREKQKARWIEKNWSPNFLISKDNIYGNALYQNDGQGNFEEVSSAMNVENFWPWGVSTGDVNADGYTDIFVTVSMNYPFRYAPNALLLNEAGKRFVDAEYSLGIEPRRGGRTAKPWALLDCDGAQETHRDCADRQGELLVHGALGSRSSVIFDYDSDGDLDIITAEFGDVPQVLQSNLAQQRGLDYLQVRVAGTRSNRSAIGARVNLVDKTGILQSRYVDGKSGYLGFSDMPLYFGNVAGASDIEVDWPSGLRERFPLSAETRKLHLVEGSGTER